jgi:hypothetical protein
MTALAYAAPTSRSGHVEPMPESRKPSKMTGLGAAPQKETRDGTHLSNSRDNHGT